MKHKILSFLFLLVTFFLSSQENKKYDFSKEIDEQLWKSFVHSYNARDGEKHIAIHAEDVLRITKNGIVKGKDYRKQILEGYRRKQLS